MSANAGTNPVGVQGEGEAEITYHQREALMVCYYFCIYKSYHFLGDSVKSDNLAIFVSQEC